MITQLSPIIYAYAMQQAYCTTKIKASAIQQVKSKYPEANDELLGAMWHAIDAYVDMQNNTEI